MGNSVGAPGSEFGVFALDRLKKSENGVRVSAFGSAVLVSKKLENGVLGVGVVLLLSFPKLLILIS